MIEHWMKLRCAGIRQAQYTDTWTCHLHRDSRLTTHTDITSPHPSRPWSKSPIHSPPTPPTPPHPKHRHTWKHTICIMTQLAGFTSLCREEAVRIVVIEDIRIFKLFVSVRSFCMPSQNS